MTAEEIFNGRLIMAPMTRGTDLPFRRLVNEWGGEVCVGEMAYAHKIVRDDTAELARIRRHPDEKVFGVQLAGKKPELMAEAAKIAEGRGADFIDINLGCPVDDATRRGFGAAMLRRPARVGVMVAAMKAAVSVPITVKLRLGWSADKPNYLKVARAAEDAGVDAIVLHARTRAQRYRRPADWSHVKALVESVKVPVIGNGDIMTAEDARRRMRETGCASVMVGRWALTKPWLFREFADGVDAEMDAEARLGVLRRYVELCREQLRDDEKGRRGMRRFLVFHQDFFSRYRRGARVEGVNSDDSREWGEPPAEGLEEWLCRSDLAAAEALCDWLVDGRECAPPPPSPDTRRAVKVNAYG